MLIEFKARNFRSFHDELTFSMLATSDKSLPANTFTAPNFGGRKLLHSAAIYGANASGKSNLVAAMQSMARFICEDVNSPPGNPIATDPFLLSAKPNTEPTSFEITFIAAGIRYQYGFQITCECILQEWLVAYPHGLPQTWFERNYQRVAASEPTWYFGRRLKGENIRLSKLTQPNQLFLSRAAQDNHPQLLPVHQWFGNTLKVFSQSTTALPNQFKPNSSLYTAIRHIMQAADFGIIDFEIEDATNPSNVKMIYQAGEGERIAMPLEKESSGVRRLFALAAPIVEILQSGGTLFVDDLDANLHPLLAYSLVNIFHKPESNPNHAQLIFSAHDTSLIDTRLLRRDQIWFVEKDRQGNTQLYALAEFSPRKEEHLARGYLLGRYGAIPFLGESLGNEVIVRTLPDA